MKKQIIEYEKTYSIEGYIADLLRWVHLAASKDETRMFSGVLITYGECVSTDGRRMHVADLPSGTGIEPGYYEVFSKKAKKIVIAKCLENNFPDYKKVIPTGIPDNAIGECIYNYNITHVFPKVITACKEKFAIDYKYFADVCGAEWIIEFRFSEKLQPVVFKTTSRRAYIMPFTLE